MSETELVQLVLCYTRVGNCVVVVCLSIQVHIFLHILFLLGLCGTVKGSFQKQFGGKCRQQFGDSPEEGSTAFRTLSCHIDRLHQT